MPRFFLTRPPAFSSSDRLSSPFSARLRGDPTGLRALRASASCLRRASSSSSMRRSSASSASRFLRANASRSSSIRFWRSASSALRRATRSACSAWAFSRAAWRFLYSATERPKARAASASSTGLGFAASTGGFSLGAGALGVSGAFDLGTSMSGVSTLFDETRGIGAGRAIFGTTGFFSAGVSGALLTGAIFGLILGAAVDAPGFLVPGRTITFFFFSTTTADVRPRVGRAPPLFKVSGRLAGFLSDVSFIIYFLMKGTVITPLPSF